MFAAVSFLAIACTTTTTTTTPDTTTENKPTDPQADAGKPKTPAADAGASSSSSSGGDKDKTPDAPECSDTTTGQECIQCCAEAHTKGYQAYMGTLIKCLCEAAQCATECATTICGTTPKNPDAACNDCINSKAQSCEKPLETACTASQDCMDFTQCGAEASCNTKK
jgi:hypothetical protein